MILSVARLLDNQSFPQKSVGKNAKQECERDCERDVRAAMLRTASTMGGAACSIAITITITLPGLFCVFSHSFRGKERLLAVLSVAGRSIICQS